MGEYLEHVDIGLHLGRLMTQARFLESCESSLLKRAGRTVRTCVRDMVSSAQEGVAGSDSQLGACQAWALLGAALADLRETARDAASGAEGATRWRLEKLHAASEVVDFAMRRLAAALDAGK